MVEFALLLPMFLFFIVFSIDAGRLMLLRAELQDATQQSARAGAQAGDARRGNVSRIAFNEAIELAPGLDQAGIRRFVIAEGSPCITSNPYVTIRTEYNAALVTPGLESLLGLISRGSQSSSGQWVLRAVSTSRCEVVS